MDNRNALKSLLVLTPLILSGCSGEQQASSSGSSISSNGSSFSTSEVDNVSSETSSESVVGPSSESLSSSSLSSPSESGISSSSSSSLNEETSSKEANLSSSDEETEPSSAEQSASEVSSLEEEPLEFQTISGNFAYSSFGATVNTAGTALITNRFFSGGTVSMVVRPSGDFAAGFAFCSDVMVKSYYSLHVESYNGNQLVLSKCVDGVSSVLGSCYISAGHSKDASIELKAIVSNGKIQCFYDNKLFISRLDSSPLSGKYVALTTKNADTVYQNIAISKTNAFKTVDTLIIGHSYMEMWANYKADLARYEDIFNIGIGGTSSNDWAGHIDEIIDYRPSKLIYMIGINDVGWKRSPGEFMKYVKACVDPLLSQLPELQVCLVSVNKCPQYKDSVTSIDNMNALLRNYVAKNERLFYADVDNAFLKADLTPDEACFIDGLHPTSSSYLTIRDAIYDAFDGVNQPGGQEFDEGSGANFIEELKANDADESWTYLENGVRADTIGYRLSSSSFDSFSVTMEFDGLSTSLSTDDNPFFSHKATKSFLFGGKEVNGKYQGYALNASYDWFEILKLDGYDSTFIDGWNIDPEGVSVKLSVKDGVASLGFVYGSSMGPTFNGNSSVALEDYEEGKLGYLRNDGFASTLTIEEIERL